MKARSTSNTFPPQKVVSEQGLVLLTERAHIFHGNDHQKHVKKLSVNGVPATSDTFELLAPGAVLTSGLSLGVPSSPEKEVASHVFYRPRKLRFKEVKQGVRGLTAAEGRRGARTQICRGFGLLNCGRPDTQLPPHFRTVCLMPGKAFC